MNKETRRSATARVTREFDSLGKNNIDKAHVITVQWITTSLTWVRRQLTESILGVTAILFILKMFSLKFVWQRSYTISYLWIPHLYKGVISGKVVKQLGGRTQRRNLVITGNGPLKSHASMLEIDLPKSPFMPFLCIVNQSMCVGLMEQMLLLLKNWSWLGRKKWSLGDMSRKFFFWFWIAWVPFCNDITGHIVRSCSPHPLKVLASLSLVLTLQKRCWLVGFREFGLRIWVMFTWLLLITWKQMCWSNLTKRVYVSFLDCWFWSISFEWCLNYFVLSN